MGKTKGTMDEKWKIMPAEGKCKGKGFMFVSVYNGMVLDINEGIMKNDAKVIVYMNGNQMNQTWEIRPVQ